MASNVVAIDGPAGSGKSSIARSVSQTKSFSLVDTGAMYRTVALLALEEGLDWRNGACLKSLVANLDFRFEFEGEVNRVFVNHNDVTERIRTEEISQGASVVSRHSEVREALVLQQRRAANPGPAVLEGRDIGTVVFPEAKLKLFIEASPEVRASRRAAELLARGEPADQKTILEALKVRDLSDSSRAIAPLRAADDAIRIDTTAMGFEEVLLRVMELIENRFF
ncbi:MAG: (d)CMP kinase [Myxococcota bacterium]|nr:(d)CMP kinase [Myxococcota bacterium]